MDESFFLLRLTFLVPLVLSLSVHEWAHAWTAYQLGDDTAKRLGRLTLNPIAHIDPIGTLVLPLIGVPFGWAKPVPVSPVRFRGVSMQTGMMLTAAAGPLSNVVLAIGCLLGVALTASFGGGALQHLLEVAFLMNVVLAIFNMIPIPPLDGSRVADGLMPDSLRPAWDSFSAMGPVGLILILVVPPLFGFSLLAWPVEQAYELIDAVRQLAAG